LKIVVKGVETMIRAIQAVSLTLMGAVVLTGCGGSSLSDSAHVYIDPVDGTAGIEIEMSDGMQVNLDGEFPLGGNGYGVISFVQPTRTENGKIRISVDLQAMVDDQVGDYAPVTSLPNGAPLPAAVIPPLFSVPVISGSTSVNAVVSVIPELQLGAMVQMAAFNSSRFPAGVAICQNFRNAEGLAYAAVCLFGPGQNESGGVFIGGTLGEVFDNNDIEGVIESDDLISFRQADPRMARQSGMMAAMLSTKDSEVSTLRSLVTHREEATSTSWEEERYDPSRRLSGSNGRKALNNARKILKAR
jgi:hypothetical protein